MAAARTSQIRPKCVLATTTGMPASSAAPDGPAMAWVRRISSATLPSSRTMAMAVVQRRRRAAGRAGAGRGRTNVSTTSAPSTAAVADSVTQRTNVATTSIDTMWGRPHVT